MIEFLYLCGAPIAFLIAGIAVIVWGGASVEQGVS